MLVFLVHNIPWKVFYIISYLFSGLYALYKSIYKLNETLLLGKGRKDGRKIQVQTNKVEKLKVKLWPKNRSFYIAS